MTDASRMPLLTLPTGRLLLASTAGPLAVGIIWLLVGGFAPLFGRRARDPALGMCTQYERARVHVPVHMHMHVHVHAHVHMRVRGRGRSLAARVVRRCSLRAAVHPGF